jgi:hypothetical protein
MDQQMIATVCLDKKVIVTSLRSRQPVLECVIPVALWSCMWMEHTTVAVDGDGGRFFIVDRR